LHDIVETPTDHIDGLATFLADGSDSILGFELSIDLSGAARDDVHDLDVVVFELERRTDAVVRQAHLDSIFLALARREITRMRIHVVGHGVHERLEDVVGRDLRDAFIGTLVSLL